jgi:hypothetical protein
VFRNLTLRLLVHFCHIITCSCCRYLDPYHTDALVRTDEGTFFPHGTDHMRSPFQSGYSHSLGLVSVYRAVTGSEPETTNVKGATATPSGAELEPFTGCLDYIWCTGDSSKLEPCNVLETLTEAQLRAENNGLPNSWNPSDHLPLGARFRIPLVTPGSAQKSGPPSRSRTPPPQQHGQLPSGAPAALATPPLQKQ